MSKLRKLKEVYESHPVFWHKYPKLIILVIFFIVAYIIFRDPRLVELISHLDNLSYLTAFFAGIFYSFGFLAPFALGFLLKLQPENLYLAALLGGIGGVLADLFIFKFVKTSFEDEFKTLKKEKPLVRMDLFFRRTVGKKIENFIIYFIALIVIASPLPDEIGVTLLAGLTKLTAFSLSILSFIVSTIAIFIILCI